MDPMDTTYASMSAPLPSPSSNEPNQYFMQHHNQHRHYHQPSSASVPRSPPRSQPLSFPKQPIQSHSQSQPELSPPPPSCQQQQQQAALVANRQDDPYPSALSSKTDKDFCLVAEAAKRAQMAVLMRDMGDLGVASS